MGWGCRLCRRWRRCGRGGRQKPMEIAPAATVMDELVPKAKRAKKKVKRNNRHLPNENTTAVLPGDVMRHIAAYLPPITRTRIGMTSTSLSKLFDLESELAHWKRIVLNLLGPVDPSDGVATVDSLKARLGPLWEANNKDELWCLYWIVSAGNFYWLMTGHDATIERQVRVQHNNATNDTLWFFKHLRRSPFKIPKGGANSLRPKCVHVACKYSMIGVPPRIPWSCCYEHAAEYHTPHEYATIITGPLDIIKIAMKQDAIFQEIGPAPSPQSEAYSARKFEEFKVRVFELAHQLELRHRQLVERYRATHPIGDTNPHLIVLKYSARDQPDFTRRCQLYTPYGCHGSRLFVSYMHALILAQEPLLYFRNHVQISRRLFVALLEWILAVEDEPPGKNNDTGPDLGAPPDMFTAKEFGVGVVFQWVLNIMKRAYLLGAENRQVVKPLEVTFRHFVFDAPTERRMAPGRYTLSYHTLYLKGSIRRLPEYITHV